MNLLQKIIAESLSEIGRVNVPIQNFSRFRLTKMPDISICMTPKNNSKTPLDSAVFETQWQFSSQRRFPELRAPVEKKNIFDGK
jgi:hypothetical protein